jgi:hypothetical protein
MSAAERNNGVSFEVKVERWLRRSRGARFTERRARQKGQIARRGHECDVHATMVSGLWPLTAVCAAFCGLACILIGVSGAEAMIAFLPGFLGVVCVVLTAAFFLDPRHVWVEVKSGETPIKRDVVWKLVGQVSDVRGLTAAPWYPSEAWLVSRSYFDIDALAFARAHGVRCFIEQGGDIREVV